MHRVTKNVIVSKNKPVLIDFERCKRVLVPKNVTQFFHFLMKLGYCKDKNKVMIVHFDLMMVDFDPLMKEIMKFINHPLSDSLKKDIKETAEKQRKFKSEHKYDLEKFGLSEQKIIDDCKPIYNTFFNSIERA